MLPFLKLGSNAPVQSLAVQSHLMGLLDFLSYLLDAAVGIPSTLCTASTPQRSSRLGGRMAGLNSLLEQRKQAYHTLFGAP